MVKYILMLKYPSFVVNIIYRGRNAVTTVVCVSACRESHSAKITFGDTNYVICITTSSVINSETPSQKLRYRTFSEILSLIIFFTDLTLLKQKRSVSAVSAKE